MKVKICGITNLEDAQTALEAGADLLGYNFFAGSARCIAVQECTRIQTRLAALGGEYLGVGVFVNESPDRIRQLLSDCGLQLAQLHGDESPQYLAALGQRAFKAIRPKDQAESRRFAKAYAKGKHPPALLVDAYHAGHFGGTGRTGDWQLAYDLAEKHELLLAGGLSPANVSQAVAYVQPWGVDVASGVETSPGRKDPNLVKEFVRQARRAALSNPQASARGRKAEKPNNQEG